MYRFSILSLKSSALSLFLSIFAFSGNARAEKKSEEQKQSNNVKSLFEKEDPNGPTKKEKSVQKKIEKEKCLNLPQRNIEELWEAAECYWTDLNYGKAVDILREGFRRKPDELDAYFVAGWLLWLEGQNLGGKAETLRSNEALSFYNRAISSNPTHWRAFSERGDFYYLRLNLPDKAYADYLKAKRHSGGDFSRQVPEASPGAMASIENRIARAAEQFGRRGEAVEASCRALYYDPDDTSAKQRIERLFGSCTRKKVEDPRKNGEKNSEKKSEAH